MSVQRKYSSNWINKLETREHWLSYWHQIKLMEDQVKPNDSLIEIGIGSGFTSNYLKSKHINVLTVDIDEKKSPDVVSDATKFTPDKSYDHFCAFEVFEHMNFDEMNIILKNIKDRINKNIFMSVPIYKKTPISIELKVKSFWKSFTLKTPKTKIIDPHHHWELNYKNYTEKKLINTFKSQNFHFVKKKSYLRWCYFHFQKLN